MKHYKVKITTIRYLDEEGYKAYKQEMLDVFHDDVDFKELEKFGSFVIRTQKPDEDVRTVYELDMTEDKR